MTTDAICPLHVAKSGDLVGLNTKKEKVFRCKEAYMKGPMGVHYFTVSSDAAARLAASATAPPPPKKRGKKVPA